MGLKRKKRLLGILIFSLVIGMMGSAGGEAEAKKKIILNKKKSRDLCWRSTSSKSKGNKEKGEVVFKGEKDCDSFKKRSC